MFKKAWFGGLAVILVGPAGGLVRPAQEKPVQQAKLAAEKPEVKWVPAVNPKPLSENVSRG